MSYLLTEIALDMLGYKFYDINGVYHTTDFQTADAAPPQNSDEPSLEDIIYPKEQSKSGERNSTDSVECLQMPNLPIPRISVNQDQLVMHNIKESIEKEVKVLCEELKGEEATDKGEKMNSSKSKDKSAKTTGKHPTTSRGIVGREDIRKETERLSYFLKCVEKSLEEANPEHFKELKAYKMDELL